MQLAMELEIEVVESLQHADQRGVINVVAKSIRLLRRINVELN